MERRLHRAAVVAAFFSIPAIGLGSDPPPGLPPEGRGEEDAEALNGWDEGGDVAGSQVRVHGSFENQATGIFLRLYNGKDRLAIYDSTRIRVDLDADLPKGLKLRTDAVAQIFVGETEIFLVNLIPKRTFDELVERDPRWASTVEDTYELENRYYIDNAYLKVPMADVLVTLGKQPLEQGAGYVWNPTDVFTDKDMFDPTYEKEGVIAARVMIPIGQIASFDLVGAPDGKFEEWTAGGRAALRTGSLSLSAASYITRASSTDVEGSMDDMISAATEGQNPDDAIHKVSARRVMVGGDAVLDIEGVRLWAETADNIIEDKEGAPKDWWELAAGVEYYFPSETHMMAEYYHYGRGPDQRDGVYSFNDWMGILSMDLKMLGSDFLFESIDQPVADFWTVGFSSFQGLNEASAAINGDVRFEFTEDAELWLLVSVAAGEPEDFLSSARGQAWLRLKAYF
jgi:hypothetical protein